MTEMNAMQFHKYTKEEAQPVLVEFWAPWCGYCRRIIPALEAVSKKLDGKLRMGRINIDLEPALSDEEQIEVVPTLVIYHKGQVLGSIVAPESRARIEEFINTTLGGMENG